MELCPIFSVSQRGLGLGSHLSREDDVCATYVPLTIPNDTELFEGTNELNCIYTHLSGIYSALLSAEIPNIPALSEIRSPACFPTQVSCILLLQLKIGMTDMYNLAP